jgi:uncharacterized protein YfdQ (DUF2303 family)
VRLARELMDENDKRSPAPLRRQGKATLHELDSFIEYVNRYKGNESLVVVNQKEFSATAILNAHPAGPGVGAQAASDGGAAWQDFRATYSCPRSPEWIWWTERDGKQFNQEQFAQAIEERLDDIAGEAGFPEKLDVLEMARNLTIRSSGEFRRTIDPTTGTGILVNKTEHGAESTKIFRAFKVALRVFDGGALFGVEARIRFELRDGKAFFSYQLHRRNDVEREAFADVRSEIKDRCQIPVLAGSF